MPRTLMVFGLGLIAAWALLKVAAFLFHIAIWLGIVLVLAGAIWHLFAQSPARR